MKTYREVREELERIRASRKQKEQTESTEPKKSTPVTAKCDIPSPPQAQISEQPAWWRFLSKASWRVQLAFTLLLWASLLNIGFGAAFFVCACIYWLYVWGTDPQKRVPKEGTILAGWYYDNERVI